MGNDCISPQTQGGPRSHHTATLSVTTIAGKDTVWDENDELVEET